MAAVGPAPEGGPHRIQTRRSSVSHNTAANECVLQLERVNDPERVSPRFRTDVFLKQLCYHILFPLSVPLVFIWDGRHLAWNIGFTRCDAQAIVGNYIFSLHVLCLDLFFLYCWIANIETGIHGAEIAILTVLFATQKVLIATKYAYMLPVQYDRLLTRRELPDRQSDEQLLSGWTRVTVRIALPLLEQAVIRMGAVVGLRSIEFRAKDMPFIRANLAPTIRKAAAELDRYLDDYERDGRHAALFNDGDRVMRGLLHRRRRRAAAPPADGDDAGAADVYSVLEEAHDWSQGAIAGSSRGGGPNKVSIALLALHTATILSCGDLVAYRVFRAISVYAIPVVQAAAPFLTRHWYGQPVLGVGWQGAVLSLNAAFLFFMWTQVLLGFLAVGALDYARRLRHMQTVGRLLHPSWNADALRERQLALLPARGAARTPALTRYGSFRAMLGADAAPRDTSEGSVSSLERGSSAEASAARAGGLIEAIRRRREKHHSARAAGDSAPGPAPPPASGGGEEDGGGTDGHRWSTPEAKRLPPAGARASKGGHVAKESADAVDGDVAALMAAAAGGLEDAFGLPHMRLDSASNYKSWLLLRRLLRGFGLRYWLRIQSYTGMVFVLIAGLILWVALATIAAPRLAGTVEVFGVFNVAVFAVIWLFMIYFGHKANQQAVVDVARLRNVQLGLRDTLAGGNGLRDSQFVVPEEVIRVFAADGAAAGAGLVSGPATGWSSFTGSSSGHGAAPRESADAQGSRAHGRDSRTATSSTSSSGATSSSFAVPPPASGLDARSASLPASVTSPALSGATSAAASSAAAAGEPGGARRERASTDSEDRGVPPESDPRRSDGARLAPSPAEGSPGLDTPSRSDTSATAPPTPLSSAGGGSAVPLTTFTALNSTSSSKGVSYTLTLAAANRIVECDALCSSIMRSVRGDDFSSPVSVLGVRASLAIVRTGVILLLSGATMAVRLGMNDGTS